MTAGEAVTAGEAEGGAVTDARMAVDARVQGVAGIIRHHAATAGDTPAVTSGGRTSTFAQLHERSNQAAAALAAAGVGEGDRVAYLDKNAPEFFELLFACAKLGAVLVPVNWRLAASEVEAIVGDSGARALVAGAEFIGLAEGPAATCALAVVVDGGPAPGPWVGYAEWLAGRARTDTGRTGEIDDVVLQLYTSGTTGLPKGVMLTSGNLLALAAPGGRVLGLDRTSVNLAPMPLFHIGGSGYALIGVHAGSHTVLARQADPQELLQAIAEHGVTNTFVVPAVLSAMVRLVEDGLRVVPTLQVVSYGASPISEHMLARAMRAFGCRFIQVYGLTETTGTVTVLDDGDHLEAAEGRHPERLRSAGRPVDGAAIRIVDVATGADAALGAVGEIWISSPQVTVGYWRRPAETAAALVDGWLRTGDAGYLDDRGYLYIHDRVKDMIISGGENVYPAEVENVVMSHPDVADVAVIGVPSERWGETVKAVVVAESGRLCDPSMIIEFARGRLAHYKCPTSVDVVDALPRNASGKILKRELRSPYWKDHDRSVG